MAENILEIRHLSKSFGSNEVLRDIDFTVEKGDVISIIGASGSGKSTLLRCINLLETPTGGQILYHGEDVAGRGVNAPKYRSHVGMVFQSFNLFNNMTVLENCMAGQVKVLRRGREEAHAAAMTYLEKVGMAPYINAKPRQLSGGQKQRVAIAGVIAMETMCIVLDEPTAMLDPRGRQEVMDTIRYLNREKGITVILITHYMDEAVQADRVVVMDGGNILTDGDPRTVFAQVELLKRHKLDVPQATELIYRLNAAGCSISGTPLDEDECVKAIAEYLKLG